MKKGRRAVGCWRLGEVTEPFANRVVERVLVEKSKADDKSKQAGWRHRACKPAHQT